MNQHFTMVDLALVNLVLLIWGGYFIAGRYALESLPPLFVISLLFLIVAVVLVPFYKVHNFPIKQIAIISFFLGILSYGFELLALFLGLDVPTTVLLKKLSVPFSCVLGALLLGDRLGAWQTSGLVVAMVGASIIVGEPDVGGNILAVVTIVISAVGWGVANILMKKLGEVESLPFLAWLSLFAGVQLLVLSLAVEDMPADFLSAFSGKVIGSILYMSLAGTLLAYWIWHYLLRRYLASQVTPFSLLGPFYSIVLAYIFLDEPLTLKGVIGGLILLVGVAVVIFRRPRLGALEKVRPQ